MKHKITYLFLPLLIAACGQQEPTPQANYSGIENTENRIPEDVTSSNRQETENTDIRQRLRDIVPAGVTISNMERINNGVLLTGIADSNAQLKNLMDDIAKDEIGSPNLKSIKNAGMKQKSFELEVFTYSK